MSSTTTTPPDLDALLQSEQPLIFVGGVAEPLVHWRQWQVLVFDDLVAGQDLDSTLSIFRYLYGVGDNASVVQAAIASQAERCVLVPGTLSTPSASSDYFRGLLLSGPPDYDKKPIQLLGKAFSTAFASAPVDPANFLLGEIQRLAKLSIESNIYAPCTTLVQGSCTGKSRTLLEIGRSKLPMLYINLGPKDTGSTGYPPGNERMRQRFLGLHTVDSVVESFDRTVVLALEAAGALIDASGQFDCAGFLKLQTNYFLEEDDPKKKGSFWDNIISTPNNGDWSGRRKAALEKIDELSSIACPGVTEHLKFLVVLDESRVLTEHNVKGTANDESAFTAINRVMGDYTNVFFVCSDTSSSVARFQPPKELHPSNRVAVGKRVLLPPLFALPTFDLVKPVVPGNVDVSSDVIKLLSQMGRPLWNALVQAGETPSAIIKLTTEKLLVNGINVPTAPATAAVLGNLVALYVSPSSALSAALVEKHMAICVSISSERSVVHATYPSDPILAEASATLFYRNPSQYINQLGGIFSSGTIDAGQRGEIAGQLVLLLAKLRVRPRGNAYFSTPVTVKTFLASLVGSTMCELLDYPSTILDAYVSFTHFSSVTYTPRLSQMGGFYKRRMAVFCKRMQKGVDMLIPVMYVSGDQSQYSAIHVQVKSRRTSDPEYPASATTKMTRQYVWDENELADSETATDEYLCLYLNLRTSTQEAMVDNRGCPQQKSLPRTAKAADPKRRKLSNAQYSLALFGLAMCACLDDNEKKELNQLLDAFPDPVEMAPDASKEAVRHMLGPTYTPPVIPSTRPSISGPSNE